MIICSKCKLRNIPDIWKHWEEKHPEVNIQPRMIKVEPFDWQKELEHELEK